MNKTVFIALFCLILYPALKAQTIADNIYNAVDEEMSISNPYFQNILEQLGNSYDTIDFGSEYYMVYKEKGVDFLIKNSSPEYGGEHIAAAFFYNKNIDGHDAFQDSVFGLSMNFLREDVETKFGMPDEITIYTSSNSFETRWHHLDMIVDYAGIDTTDRKVPIKIITFFK